MTLDMFDCNGNMPTRIAIIGTVGVPARYGGFETLAENLVHYHASQCHTSNLAVYCSSKNYCVHDRNSQYKKAELRWIHLEGNGPMSILYDFLSLIDAVCKGDRQILILGVSGAMILPLIRLISQARIVINIDGIEWRRAKWGAVARLFLRVSEWFAIRFAHEVIADNQAIADYVTAEYGRETIVIPYGGDHALLYFADQRFVEGLPDSYALALCRIEPENNVDMILDAWQSISMPLVFIGNWEASIYGRNLKSRFKDAPGITLVDSIYEPTALRAIRDKAVLYIHGHSAGGTNPSLVEMMHFGIPVIAYDCNFNRYSTEGNALYFSLPDHIVEHMTPIKKIDIGNIGLAMLEIARRRYCWEDIGARYFSILDSPSKKSLRANR